MIKIQNEQEFNEKVLQSEIPVLVDFFTEWCGPCKMVAPVLEEVAKDKEGQVAFYKVDGDQSQDLLVKYGVTHFPTLLLFKDGNVVNKHMGTASKNAITSFVES